MKKLSLLLLMVLVAAAAWAVPAKPGTTVTHRQKDGTELTLQLVGDEHFHYYLNAATGEKLERATDGDFRVMSAATFNERSRQADVRRAAANAERIKRLPLMSQMAGGPQKAIGDYANMSDTKKGLVILVNFSDLSFTTPSPQTAFYNQFNQAGYNGTGSVKDYFSAQSYDNFTVDFDVVGPVTVSKTMAYYGAPSGSDNDSHVGEMIVEAVNLADTQCGVDYSKYDWSGDGYVDQVFVVFAGYNQAQGASANTIWPHEWDLYSANYFDSENCAGPQKLDGKWIYTYACSSELAGYSGTTMDGIGTACHEFSHCLGYPDLYDTNGATDGSGWGMSYFDVMAGGSYNGINSSVPCGYSAYERWMAGWLTPTELTDPITVTDMPAINDEPAAYIIYKPGSTTEYLLLENRKKAGYFAYISEISGAEGMLVTHINYDSDKWQNNQVNADASNQRLIYIPADGAYEMSVESLKGEFFPTANVNALTSTSHTGVYGKWANGSSFANMDISEIAKSADGKISFKFNGGSANCTITLDVAGTTQTWTQTDSQRSFTLPTATTTVPGWTFAGWSTATVAETTTAPEVITAGTEVTPTADCTYYAVFSRGTGSTKHLTNAEIKAARSKTGYASGYKADAVIESADGNWSGYCAFNKNDTEYALQINANANNYHLASPDYGVAGVSEVTIDTQSTKTTTALGRKFFICSSNETAQPTAGDLGEGQLDEDNGAVTISVEGTPRSFYIYTNGTAYINNISVKVGSGTTYYSTTPVERLYTVTFNAGAGTCATASFTQTAGTSSVALPTATISIAGWAFAGWATKNVAATTTAPTLLAAETQYTPSDDCTLYAVYSATSYVGAVATVTYCTNPAEAPVNTFFTVTLSDGTNTLGSFSQTVGKFTFELPTETYTGWDFFGWADAPVAQTAEAPEVTKEGTEVTPTADITFYSVFKNHRAYISNPADYVAGGGTKDPMFYFPHIAHFGKPFVVPKFTSDSEGTLTFSSSDETVATVDSATGEVTVVGEGFALITVNQAATATHNATSASYLIKVVDK